MAPSLAPPYQEQTLHPTPIFRPAASRRTPSFSSSSRSNSWDSSFDSPSVLSLNEEYLSPHSPISTPLRFKGIPFSWEKIPGIPKHHHQGTMLKAEQPSGHHLLPLPPAGNPISAAKKAHNQEEISPKKSFQRDPFFAALVECSKDDDHHDHGKISSKNVVTRSISDRLGFLNMYVSSCTRTCAVSESIVYLPRATSPHYIHNRRSR